MRTMYSIQTILSAMRSWFLLAPLALLLVNSCSKGELEPDIVEEPPIFVQASFDGEPVKYEVGVNAVEAKPLILDLAGESVGVWRMWAYRVDDTRDSIFNDFSIYIVNHKAPYGNLTEDLDSTMVKDNFQFLSVKAPDYKEVLIESYVSIVYVDTNGNWFSSAFAEQIDSQFRIRDVEDVSVDGISYKQCNIVFDCVLKSLTTLETIDVTNGKAVILMGGIEQKTRSTDRSKIQS